MDRSNTTAARQAVVTRRVAVVAAGGAAAAVAKCAATGAAKDAAAAAGRAPRETVAVRAVLRQGAAPPAGLEQPRSLDGVLLDPSAGAGLKLGPHTAWIVPRAGLFGPGGDLSPLLREAMTIGEVVTCLEDIWVLETTPGAGGAIALSAWAEGETGPSTMLAGTAWLEKGGLRAELSTPAALRGSDRHDQIEARLTVGADGVWTGDVGATNSYWKNGPCHKRCHDRQDGSARRCRRACKHHENRKRRHKRRH